MSELYVFEKASGGVPDDPGNASEEFKDRLSRLLRSITRDQMQTFLDKKAETLSRSIVDHLRWDLNNVFRTALADVLVD